MTVKADVAAKLAEASEQVRKLERALETRAMERDDLVMVAREGGASLREIAEIAGLTHGAIARIERRVNAEVEALMAEES